MTTQATRHDAPPTTPAPATGAGFADPAALGLAGFATTTFVLSAANSHVMPVSVTGVVLGLAFFYGGIAQLLAGMWEFAKGNTFGALAFTSYGAFWLSLWYLETHPFPATVSAHDANMGVGTFLLVWTIFTAYMLIAALKTNGVVMAVFAVLFLTFIALTIGKYAQSTGWTKLGGWLGLVTAVLAWYGSAAIVANSTFKRVVLPTFPR